MNLIKAIKNLKPEVKEVFERIFNYREVNLNLKDPKVEEKFPEFKNQNLIFIEDKILSRQTIYNLSRKKRPQPTKETVLKEEKDPFCDYQNLTPEDELGRLGNERVATASNLAKMADYHSLIIFKKHHFEELTEEDFLSAINLTKEWFEKIKNYDAQIDTRVLIWNYHYRSGASILHPHFQVLAFKETPTKIKFLYERFKFYQEKFKSDYLEDYFNLGLELQTAKKFDDFKIWLNLTPLKEKEINFSGELHEKNTLYLWEILKKLKQIGVASFNLFYLYDSCFLKNLGFFLDRGEPNKLNSDFGSLEIFLVPVVSYDPFDLAQEIFQ